MHFSIPDTQEFLDTVGNTYLGYNIYVNGLFHCTVRYKQLHSLHEQLSKELDVQLPSFPPKKFFPLTINQQEERRLALEKYIQIIGQNTAINCSDLLNGFLLNAQQETVGGPRENENLDIFLMNGRIITLNVSTGEHSRQLLKKVCRHIKLPEEYDSYFGLFVIIQDREDSVNVLRKLQDFESPVITLKNIHMGGTKVVLGKNYWDIVYDLELCHNSVALELLCIQVAAEINRGWILVSDQLRKRLNDLECCGEKKEYFNIARTLRYYGYIQFAPCFCDYPQPSTKVIVAIGRNELNLRIYLTDEDESEAVFKVTRMRCWRITTLHNSTDKFEDSSEFSLELSFEYLIARNQLQWITISSEQAILMSVCLQSMIDELLLKSVGGSKSQDISGKPWTYITRDGHSRIIMGSSSTDSINRTQKDEELQKSEPIMKKLTDRFSAAKSRRSSDVKPAKLEIKRVGYDTMENNAFHVIGDDDL